MVEIHAYSKAASGGKQLSAHFKVREFACGDGSDAVLVAPRLVMVLETIRTHFDAPVVIHSGYRTPQYNAKVGGVAHSQHCYGMAATPTGRSIGNQIGNAAIDKVKEAMKAPTAGEEDNHGESA